VVSVETHLNEQVQRLVDSSLQLLLSNNELSRELRQILADFKNSFIIIIIIIIILFAQIMSIIITSMRTKFPAKLKYVFSTKP